MSDNRSSDREHVEAQTLIDKPNWRAGQAEPDRVESVAEQILAAAVP
jgi:hypothetical protein